jgi:hypothetical protein
MSSREVIEIPNGNRLASFLKAGAVWGLVSLAALAMLAATGTRWITNVEKVPIIEHRLDTHVVTQGLADATIARQLQALGTEVEASRKERAEVLRKVDALMIRAGLDPDKYKNGSVQ